MIKEFTFHSDPGHGWLEVGYDMLEKLRITSKVSTYSYRKGNTVYLEEDCDTGVFLDAFKAHNPEIDIKFKEVHEENTPIRNYTHYYTNKGAR